jgi:uncharacterized membrane protein YuzA (DUF378 family)
MNNMNKLNTLDWLAIVLVIVGGLNWGLIALFDFDLVATLFGAMSMIARVVYGLVGIAAVYLAYISMQLTKK